MSSGKWQRGPEREWELHGLSYSTWRYRKARGIPLDRREKGGRFSGLDYEAGTDRIEELRSRYRNGVPAGTVEAMVDEWMGKEVRYVYAEMCRVRVSVFQSRAYMSLSLLRMGRHALHRSQDRRLGGMHGL